jgi:hypothetical protein
MHLSKWYLESTYLDDLVDLLVLPLVRLGRVLAVGGHVVVAVVNAAIAVRRGVKVGVAIGAMPLVVGACGVRLEAAGGRGCARRGALVRVHGGRPPAGTGGARMGRAGRRAGGRAMLDYRCGGNRRVLMVAITGTLGSGLGRDCPKMSRRRRVHAGGLGEVVRLRQQP